MAVLKLCDQVGAGARRRGRGGRGVERAPELFMRRLERAPPTAGLISSAVSFLGRRKCAFAAGEGRRGAGVAAVRGGRGPL